jgi:hypothetical protein
VSRHSPDNLEQRSNLTAYTVAGFTAEQFRGACSDFFAWYDVAQKPETATSHPLVIKRFGDTIDPEDAREIFEWWRNEVADAARALESTHSLIAGGLELTDSRVEKLLAMTSDIEHCVGNLLEWLDESRLQDA